MDTILNSTSRQVVAIALDVASMAHKLIASNIANVDLKNHKATHIDFQQTMAKVDTEMRSATFNSYQNGSKSIPYVTHIDSTEGVMLHQEMLALSQNTIRYQALIESIQGLGSLNKIAISGGRS